MTYSSAMPTSHCEVKSHRTPLQVIEREATLLPRLATFQPGLPGLSNTVLNSQTPRTNQPRLSPRGQTVDTLKTAAEKSYIPIWHPLIWDPSFSCPNPALAKAKEHPVCIAPLPLPVQTPDLETVSNLPDDSSIGSQLTTSPCRKWKIKQLPGSPSNKNTGHFLQPHALVSQRMFTHMLPELMMYCRFGDLSWTSHRINRGADCNLMVFLKVKNGSVSRSKGHWLILL